MVFFVISWKIVVISNQNRLVIAQVAVDCRVRNDEIVLIVVTSGVFEIPTDAVQRPFMWSQSSP